MVIGLAQRFKVDTSPLYLEMYYIYLYKRLKEGFYQKRGFIINPKAQIKTSIEVAFPKIGEILKEESILGKIFEEHRQVKNYPMLLSTKEYKRLKEKKWPDFAGKLFKEPKLLKIKELEHILNSHSETIINFLSDINPVLKNYSFRIIPVSFGTRVTFFNNAKNKEILVTWRFDLPNSLAHVIEGIVSETVVMEATQDDHKLYEDVMGWYEREAICDFLTLALLKRLSLTTNVKAFKGTVSSLKQRDNVTQDPTYLKELGLDDSSSALSRNIIVQDRLLQVDDKKVFLTEMETRFMNTVLKNAPYAATFDEIAQNMWGEDSDRFSLYAISRTQANIRMKLRTMGYEELLLTIRGKGVAIKS
ncbi:MAG: hypothetical protein RLY61_975 [Candidatus Parcubacteria bacterium]